LPDRGALEPYLVRSHTWFVLKYLLGFEHVKNYDGSWTEWGNLVGVPIEKGDPEAARS